MTKYRDGDPCLACHEPLNRSDAHQVNGKVKVWAHAACYRLRDAARSKARYTPTGWPRGRARSLAAKAGRGA